MPRMDTILEPLAQPDEQHPFVGREQELALVASKLEMRREAEDKIDSPVLAFWGGFGVGKSWLLKKIETDYKRNGKDLHEVKKPIAVRLDLEPRNTPTIWEWDEEKPVKLKFKDVIYELWKQLAQQFGGSPSSANGSKDKEYAHAFVLQLTEWSSYYTPLIILDTLDMVLQRDPDAFERLEWDFIAPLALTDKILLVLAGRGELRRWDHFQLARRVVNLRLPDLTTNQVAEQNCTTEDVSRVLYEYTFGHPLTTELMARLLSKKLDLATASPDAVRMALDHDLRQTILRYVTGKMFENVSANLKNWALAASVLRWVNVEPLRALKNNNPLPLDEKRVGEDDAFFLGKIAELQSANFIYWHTERAAFEFTPAVRRLLAESLRDDPKAFCRAHQAAYDFFKKHLERLPQQLERHLPELYFHYSFYKECVDNQEEFTREQQAFFNNLLLKPALQSELPWLELEATLENDTELKTLEPKLYQMLLEQAKRRTGIHLVAEPEKEIVAGPITRAQKPPTETWTSPVSRELPTAPVATTPQSLTKESLIMPPLQWIHRTAQDKIQSAVSQTDNSVRVFLIHGGAGTGKTILLRLIGTELGSSHGLEPTSQWAFLDLYHGDINQSSGLENAIIKAFGGEGEFTPFIKKRDDYIRLRNLGLAAEDLEKQRAELAKLFFARMNQITQKRRLIIALDTIERTQNEFDLLLRARDLPRDTTTVNGWLIEQLKEWKNGVILLAGRPGEEQKFLLQDLRQIEKERTDFKVDEINLTGLDDAEVENYFNARAESYPVIHKFESDFRQRLLDATERHILRLDLALEILQYGDRANEFFNALQNKSPLEARNTIERLLIASLLPIKNAPLLTATLRILVAARKGLDKHLMHELMPTWTQDECDSQLESLAYKPYVKTRPDVARIFLHDEMYDICERYGLISTSEIQETSHKLSALEEEGRGFLYQLRADPEQAYDLYWRKADEYIRNSRVGVELRYRSDVLWFFKGTSPANIEILEGYPELSRQVEDDTPTVSVKRLVMRNRRREAAEIAETALSDPNANVTKDDARTQLSINELRGLYGLALVYLNHTEKGIRELQTVLDTLEAGRDPLAVATEYATNWRLNLVLGKAHNDLGYANWRNLFHYEIALREFAKALPYFEAAKLEEPLANTQDNMGRVYALLARRNRAESLVGDALERRKALGLEYRIGLSYVSRAHLHTLFGEPHRGVNIADKALNIFTVMVAQRGIALARIAKAEALRHKGKLWAEELYSQDDCAKFLREADDELGRAIDIFESRVSEPVQLIIAYNERGCVNRELAALVQHFESESENIRALSRRATDFLEESMRLAQTTSMPVLYADGCEDLARVYYQQDEFDQTFRWLAKGAEQVAENHKIHEGSGLLDVPVHERVEEFWLMMGKIELLRGHTILGRQLDRENYVTRDALEQAVWHYAFAVAYFEKFSPAALRNESTFKQIHNRLKHTSLQDRDVILRHVLPAVAERFKIDPTTLARFFEDTMGILSFKNEPIA